MSQTLINKNQAGEGFYTEDNLKAGNGISIDTKEGTYDFQIQGSPTLSNGVASGFSDSNYLYAYDYLLKANNSWEVYTAVSLNATVNNAYGIIDSNYGTANIKLTTSSTNTVRLRICTGLQNYSPVYGVDITGTTQFVVNQKMYIKATYNSTTGYALYTSSDGQTWTTEGTSSSTTAPYGTPTNLRYGDNISTGYSLNGSIYLADTYIVIDGKKVWTGYQTKDTQYIDNGVKSGTNIAITEGDADTLLLCHFDGSLEDTSPYHSEPKFYNGNTETTGAANFSTGHFGKCLSYHSRDLRYYSSFKDKLVASKELTIEFWTKKQNEQENFYISMISSGTQFRFKVSDNKINLENLPFGMYVGTSSTSYYADISNIEDFSWFHVAITIKNNVGYIFVNGKLLTTGTVSDYYFDASRILSYIANSGYAGYVDELRISSVARWTSDFEVPTRPYSENKIINCTLDPNAKANIALDNLSDAGNIIAAKASMPSYYVDTITAGASGSTYTAPSDGWYYLNGATTAQGGYGYLQESTTSMCSTIQQGFSASVTTSGVLQVKKGMTVILLYGNYTINSFKFIYAEGSISEASIMAYHGTN